MIVWFWAGPVILVWVSSLLLLCLLFGCLYVDVIALIFVYLFWWLLRLVVVVFYCWLLYAFFRVDLLVLMVLYCGGYLVYVCVLVASCGFDMVSWSGCFGGLSVFTCGFDLLVCGVVIICFYLCYVNEVFAGCILILGCLATSGDYCDCMISFWGFVFFSCVFFCYWS